jgi:hypothetical protein
MSVPLIYIAGPLGAPTPLGVRRNIERARDLGLKVAERGAYPVIPHTNTGEFYGLLSEPQLWVPGAMELLRRCDALVALPTWPKSRGARAEIEWAQSVRMPVHTYAEEGNYESPDEELYRFLRYVQRQDVRVGGWS